MDIKTEIENAIEGGYTDVFRDGCKECDGVGRDDNIDFVCSTCNGTGDGELLLDEMAGQWERFTSDPLFWQSLGKALGWDYSEKKDRVYYWMEDIDECQYNDRWRNEWHRFVDTLAEGKSTEDFFKEL